MKNNKYKYYNIKNQLFDCDGNPLRYGKMIFSKLGHYYFYEEDIYSSSLGHKRCSIVELDCNGKFKGKIFIDPKKGYTLYTFDRYNEIHSIIHIRKEPTLYEISMRKMRKLL